MLDAVERLRKRRLNRKIINATIITKITSEVLEMGRLKNFSSKYILFVCIFQHLFKNMGFQSVHSMPYYADGRTEDDIATPEIGALVAVKWL